MSNKSFKQKIYLPGLTWNTSIKKNFLTINNNLTTIKKTYVSETMTLPGHLYFSILLAIIKIFFGTIKNVPRNKKNSFL